MISNLAPIWRGANRSIPCSMHISLGPPLFIRAAMIVSFPNACRRGRRTSTMPSAKVSVRLQGGFPLAGWGDAVS